MPDRRFCLYNVGAASQLLLCDDRVERDISFAFLTDLHLSPGVAHAGERYRKAVEWWAHAFGDVSQVVEKLLDEIAAAGVDLVVFGGDNIDFFNKGTAEKLRDMCRARQLNTRFLIGNHDWESDNTRFCTHEVDAPEREPNIHALSTAWNMPLPHDASEHGGIRFLTLPMRYCRNGHSSIAVLDDCYVDWFLDQLKENMPTVVFYHYPFPLPTLEHRLRAVWRGALPCAQLAENAVVFEAISTSPNIIATFCGHAHINSEDPFADRGPWQFTTGSGADGIWRYVRISSQEPPKSLRIDGVPSVGDRQSES